MNKILNCFVFFFLLFFWSCSSNEKQDQEVQRIPVKTDDTLVVDSTERETRIPVPQSDTLLILAKENNGLYGYKDTLGNWSIQPQYELAGEFSVRLAPVLLKGKWILINRKGEAVFSFKKNKPIVIDNELSGEKSVLPISERMIPIEFPDGKQGFLDLSMMKVSVKFDQVFNYAQGLASVRKNDLWGVVDKKMNWIVEPKYDGIRPFSDGRAKVYLNRRYGFINRKGVEIIPMKYVGVYEFQEGLAFVTENDTYTDFHVIDTNGTTVLKGPYSVIYNRGFVNGEAEIYHHGKCITIDKKGKQVRVLKNGCQDGC